MYGRKDVSTQLLICYNKNKNRTLRKKQIEKIMASSIEFKRIWERYQEEGVSKSQSIVQFCQMNGIVYA